MAREDVLSAAASYIGTPFHHQGRVPHVGLDCVGLIICAYQAAGYSLGDYRRYTRSPKPEVMRRELLARSRVLDRDEPWQPGDVLWFRVRSQPQHLALWTGRDMIHAYSKIGRVDRHPLTRPWRSLLESALRYRGFDV